MDETPTDKLEAILEELETERERRQRAKVESGEIARVELTVAVGEPQELESAVAKAKADKLAELQAAGETREVEFDILRIVTGVPRGEECSEPTPVPDSRAPKWERYETFSEPPTLRPEEPVPSGAVLPTRAPSEPEYFWATLKSPTDSDPGQIVEGFYSIAGNTVTVTDASGRQISVQTLKAGQDPLIVARQLLRQANKPADFYRHLTYPELGIA